MKFKVERISSIKPRLDNRTHLEIIVELTMEQRKAILYNLLDDVGEEELLKWMRNA